MTARTLAALIVCGLLGFGQPPVALAASKDEKITHLER